MCNKAIAHALHSYHPIPRRYGMIPLAANALQCIVNGEENPKTVPSPWDFVTLLEEDRATAIGNVHKNLVKIAHVAPEIFSRTDRQTDTRTDVLITIIPHRSRGRSKYFYFASVARRQAVSILGGIVPCKCVHGESLNSTVLRGVAATNRRHCHVFTVSCCPLLLLLPLLVVMVMGHRTRASTVSCV